MFCFALVIKNTGFPSTEEFVFVQCNETVYTYSSEDEAKSYFNCVRHHAHLYQIDNDLSTARLVLQGDLAIDPPSEVSLTDEHKLALWTAYRYKSLLTWVPEPEDITS